MKNTIKKLLFVVALLTVQFTFAQNANVNEEAAKQADRIVRQQKLKEMNQQSAKPATAVNNDLQKLADERAARAKQNSAPKASTGPDNPVTVQQPANKPSSSAPAAGTQKASGTPAKPVEKSSIDEPTKKE